MDIVKLFESVVISSLMGSIIIMLILLVKSIFREKLNCYFHYYIWIIVIIKLLIPYSFESSFSIYNIINPTIAIHTMESNQDSINEYGNYTQIVGNISSQNKSLFDNSTHMTNNKIYDFKHIISIIWLLGFSLLIFLIMLSTIKVKNIINHSIDYSNDLFDTILESCINTIRIKKRVNLVYTNKLSSPSMYGIIKPVIIIPLKTAKNIDTEEFKYIVLHELSHLKRKDIAINWLITFLQSIYWFNPIILYGLHKMKQDCEIACDIHAISYLGKFENIKYGNTLIKMIKLSNSSEWIPGASSLSKNNLEIKMRIKMVANYKKVSIRGIILGIAIVSIIGVIGLTNDIGIKQDIFTQGLNNVNSIECSLSSIKDRVGNGTTTFNMENSKPEAEWLYNSIENKKVIQTTMAKANIKQYNSLLTMTITINYKDGKKDTLQCDETGHYIYRIVNTTNKNIIGENNTEILPFISGGLIK